MKERSIFWPLVMIAAGVLWLLIGMGTIPRENLWALSHTFPFILIALGLGLILRAYWRFAGMFVSVLVVAGVVFAVLYAPQLGWNKVPSWGWNIRSFDFDLGGAVAGSGVVQSETRQVSDFDSIFIDYPADITIRQGKTESVKIEAEDNLIPQLRTDVRGGTLYFETREPNWNERVNPTKPVLVTITVTDLYKVRFSSAGKMSLEDLEVDSLELSLTGAGDIALTKLDANQLDINLSGAGSIRADGYTKELSLRISGFGDFNGFELESQYADVNISGAGSAKVWAERELDARISGAGSVDYYGKPAVSKNVSGIGNINNMGAK